jgi:glycyl-tRNA synthetase beta subunit
MVTDLLIQGHLATISAETLRAIDLHESIHSAHEAYAVIKEELDEFWDQVKINPNKLSATERAERLEKMREELTQTAAMCLRTMLDLDL